MPSSAQWYRTADRSGRKFNRPPSPAERRTIVRLSEAGFTMIEIARELGRSYQLIRRIVREERERDPSRH